MRLISKKGTRVSLIYWTSTIHCPGRFDSLIINAIVTCRSGAACRFRQYLPQGGPILLAESSSTGRNIDAFQEIDR